METQKVCPRWRRCLLRAGRWALVLLLVAVLFWRLRIPMMEALGDHLISEDPVAHVDAVFVLGGSILDRGKEGARIYERGFGDHFYFTGAPIPSALEALGIDSTEAECTRTVAVEAGLPIGLTTVLNKGTSTFEEAEALLSQAIADNADTVMIISSRFHLRRVGFVFKDRFRKKGITVLLHGAPCSTFEEETWWKSEEGLIMLNNEYVKLAYYHLKY
ncbi:MAG: YdcF family protein [Flavobacteriales bacterium]|nr:YdcF family protein [Flavobacteriales bacterium]MBK6894263.1 YdcF family protein [Flavobacteriales bacterium]MBK7248194.1 YdcF family protein [Flavobacteriales bacterium]MBK7287459.1 YdcF family protein [Flavobacteriales bacterium]MBK9059620.1 YdcF family protein [Flavobacteriales bacterium]